MENLIPNNNQEVIQKKKDNFLLSQKKLSQIHVVTSPYIESLVKAEADKINYSKSAFLIKCFLDQTNYSNKIIPMLSQILEKLDKNLSENLKQKKK